MNNKLKLICSTVLILIIMLFITKYGLAHSVHFNKKTLVEKSSFKYKNKTKKVTKKTISKNSSGMNTNKLTINTSKPSIPVVEYNGVVRHLFFHCLIAFPEANGSQSLAKDCVTVNEFKSCLNELYANNYVLIDINSSYEIINQNGVETAIQKKVMVPEGKKPLIMSVDDIVYDSKKMGHGMVDKIILDSNGKIATSTKKPNGEEIIARDNEILPILDDFVAKHPDFSYNGAKATLACTGWEGILGYRISHDYPESKRKDEIKAVKPIVKKLKETGWTFASHSFGHGSPSKTSDDYFIRDVESWQNEIEPIVGPTKIYIYPYGEVIPTNSPKFNYLINKGFLVMCGVCQNQEWFQFKNTLYMSRYSIDGTTLANQRNLLLPLFDANKVYDIATRSHLGITKY